MTRRLGLKRLSTLLLGAVASILIGGGALAGELTYSLASGISLQSVAMEMKQDGDQDLCFISVAIANVSGSDGIYEIEIAVNEGFIVTTYTGGPNKKPLKEGKQATAQFKTLLTELPTSLEISVRPLSE